MCKSMLALFLIISVSPVFAAHQVNIAQLEQQLAALHSKPDAEAAYAIGEMQLTERMSAVRLRELQKDLPGDKSRNALWAIAAVSGFVEQSAQELPSKPIPDVAEQRRIMGLVVSYVKNAIPQLPNFLATRVTARFEDTPLVQKVEGGFTSFEPLHFLAAENAQVGYQSGREDVQPLDGSRKPASEGLSTRGVFGPILGIVLVDAAQSKLAWNRWEQGADGILAVFQYAVPMEKSHYEVDYCCVAEEAGSVAANVFPYRKLAAYHGEMAVDPETGAIRRVLLIANLKTGEPVVKANILVEYGPVEIGGKTYICPVHSVSMSLAQTVQANPQYHFALANQPQPLKNSVSDVVFSAYHVFRTETRVLADGETPALGTAPAQAAATGAPASNEAAPQPTAANQTQVPMPAAAPATSAEVKPPTAPPAESSVPEESTTAVSELAETPEQERSGTPGFTLHMTSRLVDFAVVAFDRKGRPITDLKPEDLEIYDNGRKQELRFFSHAGSGDAVAQLPASSPGHQTEDTGGTQDDVVTNREPDAANPDRAQSNTTVLMIDAAHVAFNDLNYARSEILRFLKNLPADERVGLYILGSHGFQALTEPNMDHAGLALTLAKWMPRAADLAHAQDEEQRNHEQFDWVHSVTDLASVNGNGQGGNDPEMYASGKAVAVLAANPSDAELRPMGDRPEDFVLHLLVGVGRHLAAIPGHKMLVWISSDNVLADFSSSATGREDTGNRFLDPLAIRARETLNEGHVSIYPLDISQLESNAVTADLGNRNVQVVGMSGRDPATARVGDMAAAGKNGRDTARMQEDTHPIQGTFRDLATATGGRALRRAGDIAFELQGIVADGRAAYLVSFTPDTPADDKYHVLTVKTARPGITLRYRNGYMYAKEPATMEGRLQEAVWQPRELNEIGLTARRDKSAVKVMVDATDLALAQQGQRWAGKMDVFLVLRDDSSLHATMRGKTLQFALKPDTYQQALKEGIELEEPLPMNPEGRAVRILVVDENSRRMGSITIPLAAK
jgi:VWFA-related protein